MTPKIRDVMTTNLVQLEAGSSVDEAARQMRERDVGDVLVTRDGKLAGILTDRDIVVRGIAEGADPRKTPIEKICTPDPATLSPEEDWDAAVRLIGDKAIRRIPVVEDGKLMGIVSLGDLAQERDRGSALGRVSSAQPTR